MVQNLIYRQASHALPHRRSRGGLLTRHLQDPREKIGNGPAFEIEADLLPGCMASTPPMKRHGHLSPAFQRDRAINGGPDP